MANVYGFRILVAYYEGRATEAHLDRALQVGWINQPEYDRALTGEPPIGYVAPLSAASQSAEVEITAGSSTA